MSSSGITLTHAHQIDASQYEAVLHSVQLLYCRPVIPLSYIFWLQCICVHTGRLQYLIGKLAMKLASRLHEPMSLRSIKAFNWQGDTWFYNRNKNT